jgi:predicted ester cyclase
VTAEGKSEKKPPTTAKVTRAYFEALAEQDLEAAVALWKPGGKDHLHGLAEFEAPTGVRQFFANLFGAFPDWRFEVLELAASGQNAAVRWRTAATFSGPGRFQGLAPTGTAVVIEGCDMLRVVDGQIVENNAYTSGTELAQQLGLLPKQGSFADRAVTGAFNARTAASAAVRKLREA